MALPLPDPHALAHSQRVHDLIAREIGDATGGWISFARFMDLALYAPGLGYYAAGAHKFGARGDFVTAPELTPLFAAALARQAAEIMAHSRPQIIEAGAGSGRLAADLLRALEALDALPERYAILEVSADLAERQHRLLAAEVPHLLPRVRWLTQLPERFSGLLLGNEVLDAMPVHLVCWQCDDIAERGVSCAPDGSFVWQDRPAHGRLRSVAEVLGAQGALPAGYVSEINLAASAWVGEWARRLEHGALLLIDYGFPQHEYYHPQRNTGTLMCHYRHHAHGEPFYLPGLQDITAHVDFTAVAEAAFAGGLDVLGYTSQGQFLLNCGILDALGALPTGTPATVHETAAVQKLLSPAEMGEFFKVLAAGRGMNTPLRGFTRADRLHTL